MAVDPWTEAHTAQGTADMVRTVLRKWNINADDISFANTDNAPVMFTTVRDHFPQWTTLGCSPHWLQLTIVDGLFGSFDKVTKVWQGKGPQSIHESLAKWKAIALKYLNSPTVLRQMKLIQDEGSEQGELTLNLLVHNSTRWRGVYFFLDRMKDLHQHMQAYEGSLYAGGVRPHIEEGGEVAWSLTAPEYFKLKALVATLKLFYDCTQVSSIFIFMM